MFEELYESIRERIAKFLESSEEPVSAEKIANVFDLDVKDVYIHLEHIAKSIRRESGNRKALLMTPPRCRKCGYVFKDLEKPKKPSKCPRCKSEWIEPPKFIVRSL
ncbi:transcriptional regulator [Ignisphaera sp. 4213-co]|uniref:Transcriptional regulator n=1 Tax=Ignisphaera cupida TaxID=3050454 RepID=A0ABD4Z8W5_9CREN|nr:transcriptional regulator [Ignisphaera sp. 4213-co]MDK6029340.1 transcriptional regulator [Ignisphaera sp. 4213-co]